MGPAVMAMLVPVAAAMQRLEQQQRLLSESLLTGPPPASQAQLEQLGRLVTEQRELLLELLDSLQPTAEQQLGQSLGLDLHPS